jgi:crotonobetainyl-CoA:carnitine CoA-transferase CaiB-like acyl-CoA transferase
MRLLGVGDDPRFTTFGGRVEHRDELDALLAAWVAARPVDVVVAEFTAAEAAIAPVMDMAAISADPHVEASGMIVEVEGVPMQGLVAHRPRPRPPPGRSRPRRRRRAARRDGWVEQPRTPQVAQMSCARS